MSTTKIIVLDDDPTGSQTVHSCLLLTRWDIDTLIMGLQDNSPIFFILTNTRGMGSEQAAELTREVCKNLQQALEQMQAQGTAINPILVSRSDSTLRGHYPVETDVIAEELGPFDAHFLIPAFFEGGRITRNSTHYLMVDGKAVPVHETEFAKDSVFGFSTAFLPDYVEEKTRGRITARHVERFLLKDVRGDSLPRLMGLHNNTCCVVDSETQDDLNHFAEQLNEAATHGKRFLFRSAASLLTALAKLPPQPVAPEAMAEYVLDNQPGAIIIGSHVKKTTQQLQHLLELPEVTGIEVDVEQITEHHQALLDSIIEQIYSAHASGQHPAIYTSRTEKAFPSQQERLAFGEQVSGFLMAVVDHLPTTLGYLISKGGITSNDVLSKGLNLRSARVVGQILPGCSVVRCPQDDLRHPNMPLVIFPGNVGDDMALATAVRRLIKPGKKSNN